MKTQNNEKIQVVVRIRPLMPFETARKDSICAKVIGKNQLILKLNSNQKTF